MNTLGVSARHALLACFIGALALPAVALSDQAAATSATSAKPVLAPAPSGKGVAANNTVERRATITAIDAATRTITLKGEKDEYELEVSPEVKDFDKLKVGDVVVATYTQSIAAHIAAPGEATPGVTGSVKANPIEKGNASASREVTASLKVEAVDTKANTVTLSAGNGHSQTVQVTNPKVQERLKTLKPGDVVVITYNEALALKLQKVAP